MNWLQMHNNYVWIKHFTGHDIKQKFLAIHHINVLVNKYSFSHLDLHHLQGSQLCKGQNV